jgi:3-hydroxyacyl-[acyl-carrier-protein] dehydratase
MNRLQREILSSLIGKPYFSEDDSIIGTFCFDKTFIGFSGHFPEYPVLPAFIQLFCASILVRLAISDSLVPVTVEKAKFSKEIKPDDIVTINCKTVTGSSRMIWKIQVMSDQEIAASFLMRFQECK